MTWVLAMLALPAAVGGGWLGLAVLIEQVGARRRAYGPVDAIVVPGAAVRPDGSASPALRRRVLHAVELWHAGVASRMVLTGGVGTFPPSEAEVAAAIAVAHGVPRSALVLEDRSTTTAENAAFTAELLAHDRVLIVTDSYHVLRAQWAFALHFPVVHAVGARPDAPHRLRYALREVPAIVRYARRGFLARPGTPR